MGKPKQTLPIGGELMLQKVLDTFRKTKVDGIVVVLGAHEREVRRRVRFEREKVVSNPTYSKGMSGSLKVGIAAVGRHADAAIIALADQPFLSATTVDKLIDEYSDSRAPIVIPVYDGRRGNPVLFDKSVFPQLMKIRGDVGAKSVVENNSAAVLEVPVKDEGVVVDLDTLKDYRRATAS